MLNIDNAEMSVVAKAADTELTLIWVNGKVRCLVKGVELESAGREVPVSKELEMTLDQAAATLALFVNGGDFSPNAEYIPEVLSKNLYAIAEPVWKGVPQSLRPIP